MPTCCAPSASRRRSGASIVPFPPTASSSPPAHSESPGCDAAGTPPPQQLRQATAARPPRSQTAVNSCESTPLGSGGAGSLLRRGPQGVGSESVGGGTEATTGGAVRGVSSSESSARRCKPHSSTSSRSSGPCSPPLAPSSPESARAASRALAAASRHRPGGGTSSGKRSHGAQGRGGGDAARGVASQADTSDGGSGWVATPERSHELARARTGRDAGSCDDHTPPILRLAPCLFPQSRGCMTPLKP